MDYQIIKDLIVTHLQLYATHKKFVYVAQQCLEWYNNPPELIKRLKTQLNALYSPKVRKEVLDLLTDVEQITQYVK